MCFKTITSFAKVLQEVALSDSVKHRGHQLHFPLKLLGIKANFKAH